MGHRDIVSAIARTIENASFRSLAILLFACFAILPSAGCNLVPDLKYKPQYHNPFPQISRVAVLPFRNQSQEPTLSGSRVSQAYYNELQSIRGFEVVPTGVVDNQLMAFETQVLRHPMMTPADFQQFAKFLGVDAVLQGAITDYDAYYPPRMTLKVNWYAANPGFHPIPVGYGLPWGTKKEKKIPEWIRLESERSLAAEQLKTQSPVPYSDSESAEPSGDANEYSASEEAIRVPNKRAPRQTAPNQPKKRSEAEPLPIPNPEEIQAVPADSEPLPSEINASADPVAAARVMLPVDASVKAASYTKPVVKPAAKPTVVANTKLNRVPSPQQPQQPEMSKRTFEPQDAERQEEVIVEETVDGAIIEYVDEQGNVLSDIEGEIELADGAELPANWPDPQGFIPPRPAAKPPEMIAQYEPIISHMRAFNGNDEDFTQALGEYFYFRDDARFGGWQSYLQRSEDFIRFCCHQHIVETLASRGGQLESRMILRWPLNRYER